jgi:hypothetical protein
MSARGKKVVPQGQGIRITKNCPPSTPPDISLIGSSSNRFQIGLIGTGLSHETSSTSSTPLRGGIGPVSVGPPAVIDAEPT